MITFDEINEQPSKFAKVSEKYFDLSKSIVNFLKETDPSEINFVGCGSSYNLAMGLSFQLNRLGNEKIPSKYFSGSEVAFQLRKFDENSVLVGLSRSGETTETVQALKRVKDEFGVKTLAISCEPESSLTKVADVSVVLDFVNEKSVVMTQSFTSMAFFTSALIRDLVEPDRSSLERYLRSIPNNATDVLKNTERLLEKIDVESYDHFVFLGYDEYFASSLEGVTKVTETSLSEVEAFQTLEYRHGPKSKVSEKTLACVLSNHLLHSEEEKMAHEIANLGGTVINISKKEMKGVQNLVIPYNSDDFGDWFLKVIPLQIFGVKKAIKKGLDPDNPKNLTRVVKL